MLPGVSVCGSQVLLPLANGVPARLSYVLFFCKSYVFCISILATIISLSTDEGAAAAQHAFVFFFFARIEGQVRLESAED